MNKKILLGLGLLSLAVAPDVFAQLNATAQNVPSLATNALFTTLNNVGNLVFGLLLAIAAIFIILAGYDFVTAAGDAEKITAAKNYVIYALAGIVVAYLAKSLIKYVSTLAGS